MINLNDNLMCAIDVETTGINPVKHDIIEIAIVPLQNNLDPWTKIMPFHLKLKPESPDNIDWEAIKVARTYDESLDQTDINLSKTRILECLRVGVEATRAADLLVEWFEDIGLKSKKRLVPLAHNWLFDSSFIKAWIGEANYDYIFDVRFRDTMVIAAFLNDFAEWSLRFQIPFHKLKLSLLANKLGIEQYNAHNALDDAVTTAKVYKQILQGFAFSPRITQEEKALVEDSIRKIEGTGV